MAKRPPKAKPRTKAEIKAAAGRAEARSQQSRAATVRAEFTPPAGVELISENDMHNLLNDLDALTQRKDRAVNAVRERISKAVTQCHLDKVIFPIIRKFRAMDPEERALKWEVLLSYMESSGLNDEIAAVGKLPLGEPVEVVKAAPKKQTGLTGENIAEATGVSKPRLAAVGGAAVAAE